MSKFKITMTFLFMLLINYQICIALNPPHIAHAAIGHINKYQTSCNQDQDCADNGQVGSYVPDPKDCHNYYVCELVGGEIVASDSPVSCPDGQYFNSASRICQDEIQPCSNTCEGKCSLACFGDLNVVPYPGDCSLYQICLFGGDTVLERCPTETPYFTGEECSTDPTLCCDFGSDVCSLTCSGEMDLIPHPGDCSLYHICLIGGETELEVCPTNRPYFNGANCTSNPSSCCEFCTLDCTETGVQIPDPCNCQMYYICVDLGVPSENLHETCPEGSQFDPILGTCVTGSGCTPICTSSACEQLETSLTTQKITETSIPTTTLPNAVPLEAEASSETTTLAAVGPDF